LVEFMAAYCGKSKPGECEGETPFDKYSI